MAAAPIHGKVGAFYAALGIIRANTISFSATASILDSASGFSVARFVEAQKITIVGSVANDASTHVITGGGVSAGTITTTGTPAIVGGVAGPMILMYQNAPGGAPYGFKNWSIDWNAPTADVTNFQSAGFREFTNGIYDWKGTGERNFSLTDDTWTTNIWMGGVVNSYQWVRFFVQYKASPAAAPNQAIYYEGLALVTSSNVTWPHDDVVTQKYDIQGVGALTPVIKTDAW